MIRLAVESDAQRIGELWAEMARYHAQFDALTFRPAANGAALYSHSIRDRLHDPRARVLVLELKGDIAGYISGLIADITAEMFEPLRCGLIADIYIAPAYRRQGWGKRLVERLALWFRDQEIAHFEWSMSAGNEPAFAFWKAIGGETTMLRMRAQAPRRDP